jgi:DMSO/TMAO reductase YedYZ molybdopterin-dependent catalytic subunit
MQNKLGKVTQIKQDQEGLDVPPGQFVTEKFPVLTYGDTPQIDLETWQFRVFGLVDEEFSLDWNEFMNLPQTQLDAEFHCVTQ